MLLLYQMSKVKYQVDVKQIQTAIGPLKIEKDAQINHSNGFYMV
jgi:hypothetical protein